MKKYGALILGLALSWQTIEAKTVLISDIDDTIKNSHILDDSEKFKSPMYLWNETRGMAQIYNILVNSNLSSSSQATIPVYYVSNAPELFGVMPKSHSLFLEINEFPTGTLKLRESLLENEHKVKAITAIIEKERPTHLIMVGDNGEHDIPIYQEIRHRYPEIEYSMYFRMGYFTQSEEEPGVALLEGQEGFATSFDLLLLWLQKGFVSSKLTKNYISSFANEVNNEGKNGELGPLAFPKWVDCRDVAFSADLLLAAPADSIADARLAMKKIVERCSIPGSEN